MKKVIGKILILFLIVFAINQIVRSILIPYDWGDSVLHNKNQFFNENTSKYNTAFVGGSLFYRHIDATKFDSINTAYGLSTTSFNYGVDGNNHIKQMILMDHLIENSPAKLKYIFVALSSDAYFEDRNMHTKKFVTWVDFKSLKYALKVIAKSDATKQQKWKVSYQYAFTWLENQLNAGMGLYLLNWLKDESDNKQITKQIKYDLGDNLDGFNPYFFEENVDSASLSYEEQLLYWTNNHFKRNLSTMDSINQTYKEDFTTYVSGTGHINDAMLDKYLQLINKGKEKGIQVIVLLPPRSRLSYKTFLPLYEALPEENRMNMANIFEYPEFYSYNSTFNFYHMNAIGANIYTEAVAQKFLQNQGIDANFYQVADSIP